MEDILVVRSGRRLEVREYGDPGGHPAFFFHGLIGSHHQASYIDEQAKERGLRVIAPNRPGVGRSEFTRRRARNPVSVRHSCPKRGWRWGRGLEMGTQLRMALGFPCAVLVLGVMGTSFHQARIMLWINASATSGEWPRMVAHSSFGNSLVLLPTSP